MSLDDEILKCLTEFTNTDNHIREEAENYFNELIDQNRNDEILTSLLNIINSNPRSTASFSALIRLKYLSFSFISMKSLDNEYNIFFKNTILNFFTDLRFSQDMRQYLLDIIVIMYVFSMKPQNAFPFPEVWEFFERVLSIPELYADVINFYCNFLSSSTSQDIFDFYDEEKVQFLFFHLDPSCTQRDRSYTLNFFVKFWDEYSSDFSTLIDFLSILNDFDEKYFRFSLSHLISSFVDGKIDLDIKLLYEIIYNRIIDEENDELFRQFCLYNFSYIICINKPFYLFTFSEASSFINLILVSANDPHRYPLLYEEIDSTIKNMLLAFRNDKPIVHLILQLIQSENLYISSLFLKYVSASNYIQDGIFCATNEDLFIRKNGLLYIKKIIKHSLQCLYLMQGNVVEEIGSILLDIFDKFRDQLALKVFAKWCDLVRSDTLSTFTDQIMSLCTDFLTFESIKCGTALLRLNDPSNEDSSEYALFLLHNVYQILSPDYQLPSDISMSLSDLVNCLPDITLFIDMENTIKLMDFIVPLVCSDEDSLFSKGFSRLLIQLGDNINIYDGQILSQLFNIFQQSLTNLDTQSISNFLNSISSYGKLFSIFENNCLHLVLNICSNIINERDSPTSECIPEAVKTMRKMLTYFKENEELFNSLFQGVFDLFAEEYDIYNISAYLKLIKKLAWSTFFDDEKSLLILEIFKQFFDHCSEIITEMKENDNVIQMYECTEIAKISNNLLGIFSSIFCHCPKESCQLIFSEFIHLDNFIIELQIAVANIYFEILQKDEKGYSKDFEDQLMHNLLTIISTIPVDQEGYQETYDQLSPCELTSLYSLQNLTISGLGNLFAEKKNDTELIDQLIEKLIQIISFKIEHDLNGEHGQLQSKCIFCLSKLVYSYKLNQEKFDGEIADLIFQWLPNCSIIDNLSFYSIFNIVLFCVSTNILDNEEKIQKMLDTTLGCIRENKVKSEVLVFILRNNQNTGNGVIQSLLSEIQNFLD